MARQDQIALWMLGFLDLLGFGMLISDIQLRAESLVPKGAPTGMIVGSILAVTFLIQTIVSPWWGRLSDRWGRKPVILICTLLSAAAMALYGLANALPLIFASRVVSGFGAANVAIAQAEVGARTSPKLRSATLGRLSAAISAGLIVGAPLGGFIAEAFGSQVVGWVAATASLLGALAVLVLLTPSAPVPSDPDAKRPVRFALLREIPAVRPYAIIAVVAWISLATLEGTFARLIHQLFGMGQREFGVLFGYESLLGVVVQALLLAWITRRFAEGALLRAGYLAQGVGLALNPLAAWIPVPALATLFLASTIYALGAGVANPMVNSICSRLTPDSRQGELFGLLQGARSIGFIVGPIVGGRLFDWQPASPYVVAGLVSIGAALLVPTLSDQSAESRR